MKNRTVRLLFSVLLVLSLLIGCDMPGMDQRSDVSPEKSSDKQTKYEIPEYRDVFFSEDKAEGNDEILMDLSYVNDGYVSVYTNTDVKMKFQVVKGDMTYTYNLRNGEVDFFPLQSGDGSYRFRAMKHIEGNKYYELYGCEAEVTLNTEFEPFLRANQYAPYTLESDCVNIARELAEESTDENDFISKVYDYVCKTVKYDDYKAETVESGYLPDPDETLETGKGICFDYASLTASMLRSQGIPTKIIFGYVAPDDLYHAWNMFYTEKDGWVSVKFKVDPKKWNRVDLTFIANGASSKFVGDGSNYAEVYQF